MQFHKLTIDVTLAIAAIAGLQAVAHAATTYDFIAKQIGLQTVQPPVIQLTPQVATPSASPAEETSINQKGQTFFSHPPQLIRAVASPTQPSVPSTYEFTLMVPNASSR